MMVNYWLCITDQENWHVIKSELVWGVSGRYKAIMEQVKLGDLLVFYVKPKRICGIFIVSSEPYTSTKRIFKSGGISGQEIFPHRVKLKPLIVLDECLDFESLISRLNFIRKKDRWTAYLRRAMVPLSEYDFKLIEGALKMKQKRREEEPINYQ